MSKIVLLSCTKSKLEEPAKACDLYSPSPMFQKTLAYGESLRPDKMFILSAKHHLVPMDKKLAPYELTLKTMGKDEKDKWGEIVIQQMEKSGINIQKDKFIFLTGSEYMKPLLDYIPEKNIETPMDGKRMGERLQWLNSQINEIKKLVRKIKNIIYECVKKY